MTIDLTGNNLKDIFLVKDSSTEGHSFAEQAILQLENKYLVVNVNPDTDEIETTVQDHNPIDTSNPNVFVVSRNSKNWLFDTLGLKLIWYWTMTNNQGYSDGIQFQFGTNVGKTIQLVAIASRFDINFLTTIEIPST